MNSLPGVKGKELVNVPLTLLRLSAATSVSDGLVTAAQFRRLLQKEIYKYSAVEPDGDGHIAALGAKFTAWCGEEAPIFRQYETNDGAGGGYRQGLALMFRSMGGTEKFTLCCEGADKDASVRRLLLLHHSYGKGGWAYADGVDLTATTGSGGWVYPQKFHITGDKLSLLVINGKGLDDLVQPDATAEAPGVMSAVDKKELDDLVKNGHNWYRYGAVRAPQLFTLTTAATSDEVKAALTDIAGNHPGQEGLDACIAGHQCLAEYVMGGTVMVGWSGQGYVLTYVGQFTPASDVYACTITVSATDKDGETTYAIVRDGTRIKVTAYGNVTEASAGLASAEMFKRLLQKDVYKYSGVAGDGEEHYSQLGGKLLSWCGEAQPIFRQYETNDANSDYRQGLCLMWRSIGDTARFAVCFEGADRSALTGRAFLLRFDNTDGAWAYKGYIDLSGQEGQEYLSEWIATVQGQAVATQPAVFDSFTLMAVTAELTGTENPERIVFDRSSGRFLGMKGGKYYAQWIYTNGEAARRQLGAYTGAGKTFLRSSGGLYVLTEAGALERVGADADAQTPTSTAPSVLPVTTPVADNRVTAYGDYTASGFMPTDDTTFQLTLFNTLYELNNETHQFLSAPHFCLLASEIAASGTGIAWRAFLHVAGDCAWQSAFRPV